MEEVFKSIKGYDGLYEVSNLGRVKSLSKKWARRSKDDTILKQVPTHDGYMYVTLSFNNVMKKVKVHRIVAIAFCINKDNKTVVNHIN